MLFNKVDTSVMTHQEIKCVLQGLGQDLHMEEHGKMWKVEFLRSHGSHSSHGSKLSSLSQRAAKYLQDMFTSAVLISHRGGLSPVNAAIWVAVGHTKLSHPTWMI